MLRTGQDWADSGVTMAQHASGQRAIPQSKEALLKSYQKRLKDDIKSMIEHYTEIVKLGRVCMFSQVVIFRRLVGRL